MPAQLAEERVLQVVQAWDVLMPRVVEFGRERGRDLEEAHNRVREASEANARAARVEPQLPPDLLGVYVYLPT